MVPAGAQVVHRLKPGQSIRIPPRQTAHRTWTHWDLRQTKPTSTSTCPRWMISRAVSAPSAHHAEGEVDMQRRVRRAGVFVGEPGYCPGREWGEVARSGEGPAAGACVTRCTPNDAPVTSRRGLRWSGLHLGPRVVPRRGWQRYSTEVQQLTGTRADLRGRGRTVTCTDRRGWTCCRQMACKRSAVRARLAPPGQPYNSNNLKRDFGRLVALPGAAPEPSQPPLTTSSALQA
jgi:hypothetical protein